MWISRDPGRRPAIFHVFVRNNARHRWQNGECLIHGTLCYADCVHCSNGSAAERHRRPDFRIGSERPETSCSRRCIRFRKWKVMLLNAGMRPPADVRIAAELMPLRSFRRPSSERFVWLRGEPVHGNCQYRGGGFLLRPRPKMRRPHRKIILYFAGSSELPQEADVVYAPRSKGIGKPVEVRRVLALLPNEP
jgi:hypothetical protein